MKINPLPCLQPAPCNTLRHPATPTTSNPEQAWPSALPPPNQAATNPKTLDPRRTDTLLHQAIYSSFSLPSISLLLASRINLSHSSSSSLGHGSNRSTCTTLPSRAAARVPLAVTSSSLASDAEEQSVVPCGASVALPLPAKAEVQVLDEAVGGWREIGEVEVRSFGTSTAVWCVCVCLTIEAQQRCSISLSNTNSRENGSGRPAAPNTRLTLSTWRQAVSP